MDLSSYAMSDLLGTYNQIEADRRARERRTEAFRSDPNKLDKLVATITANISPTGKKPKLSDFSSQSEAYDSVIPGDHPLKGFSSELKQRMSSVIADPRSRGLSPIDIADHLTKKILGEPGKSGAPRLQEAMEYKRRADAALFGLGGEDETVRKPYRYEEWLSGMKESEKPENILAQMRAAGKTAEADEYERELSPLATPGGLALNIGAGALGGGIAFGLPGAALGAVGGAVSEIFGRPIHKYAQQTEWYKSKWGPKTSTREEASITSMLTGAAAGAFVGSKYGLIGGAIGGALGAGAMTDTGKQLLTDIAPYAVGQIAFDKALAAAFLVPKSAGKAIAAMPSAKNIIEGGEAIEAGKKLMSEDSVIGRTVNKLFDTSKYELGVNEDFIKGWTDIARRVSGKDKASKAIMNKVIAEGERHSANLAETAAEVQAGRITAEEYTALASRAMKNIAGDPIAFEEAMRHPDGFIPGAIEASVRQRSRKFTEDLTAKVMVQETSDALEMANAVLNKTTAKASKVVSRVFGETDLSQTHDILYGGKQYVPEMENVHEVLYGGRAPTSTVARVIDDVAQAKGIPPSKAFTQVAKVMNTYETDPVAKKVIDTVTAPTDITAVFPADTGSVVMPTARKLSAKMRVAKIDLLRKAGHEEEAAYQEALLLREQRLAAQAREASLAKEPSVPEESLGRTKVKEVYKVDEVATEAEAKEAAKDVGLKGKGAKVAAEKEALLSAQKAAESEYFKEAERIRKLDPDAATELISSIAKTHASGQMTAEEALKKSELILDTITDPAAGKFATDEGLYEWAGRFDGFIGQLRAKVGTKAFMAAFGVPAGLVTFFTGKEGEVGDPAEAGIADSLVRGLASVKDVGKASALLMKNMKAAGYITDQAIPNNKFLLHYSEYQRGLKGTAEGGPANIISKFQDWASKGHKESLRYKMMSPGAIFDEVLGIGKQLMNNPAVFKASYQAAEYNNIMRSSKVIENILRDSGITSAAKEVRQMFKPLLDGMHKQVEFEYRSERIKDIGIELERYATGRPKGMKLDVFEASKAAAEKELAQHQAAIEPLTGTIPKFHEDWAKVAEEAAKKYPSVRTFLALGDSPQFEKYPFLKNIQFTPDEKVAVGRMREQLLQYKQRLKDIGEETIENWYAPHIFHPDFKGKDFLNLVGGDTTKANTYMRFYRRSFNSRPLMPDLEASMFKYVSDAERRIQQETFWKKEGWDKVMMKTQDIPVIYNAFKALKEGVAPVEGTAVNKLMQRYMEFETVKRLFLSPSATLKHLIKVTGDLASRPFSETAEATPANIKMLGIRFAEANPKLRPSLEKLGFTAKTEQDRLIQDYFKSIVPAHGIRRMMLDLGLSPADEVFTRAKGIWGKIQDIGGAGINFAELSDRGLTVTLGRQVAAKQGMTIEQALYGTYDMLLKNNFLSREFNPAWLNNPKIKAMMMFQGTPFKIFERRMVNFLRSGRVVKDLGQGVYEATKADIKNGNFNNTRMILKDLRNLHATVKQGEHELSSNLFLNAALQETDFFGQTTVSNFAKDLLITGAATYGAGTAGMNLYHHFFHLPFLQSTTDEPTLNLNPGITAIMRGYKAWEKREEGDDEFLVSKIMQRWLGSGWLAALPDPVRKAVRISNDDIPKIYQDSKYKYLFAIPSMKTK